MRTASLLPVVIAVGGALTVSANVEAQFRKADYENPVSVLAAEVVPRPLFRSPHYQVDDDVGIRENTYQFRVESELGAFTTSSLSLLRIRLNEIATLAQAVSAFNRNNRKLGAEIRGALRVRKDNFADILTSPLTTAASLAGQLTQNVGETVGLAKRKPHADKGGNTRPVPVDAVAAAHRRTVASQLGLDVYSTNPSVQQFFDAVVKAREAGSVGTILTLVRKPTVATVHFACGQLDAQVATVIRQLSADEVNAVVRDELLRMKVALPATRAFMNNTVLSPLHRLSIVAHLDFLGAMPNRGAIVGLAARARGEAEGLAYVELARMFASYHERVQRIVAIEKLGAFPMARTARELVLFVPADIVHWDERSDRLTNAFAERALKQTKATARLVVLGNVTERARTSFNRGGVDVFEQFLTPR